MFDAIIAAGTAVVTAAVYGGYAYLTGKLTKPDEPFDGTKFAGTMVVAAGIGVAFYIAEVPLNEGVVLAAITTIGGVEIGQKIAKPVWNWLVSKFGTG